MLDLTQFYASRVSKVKKDYSSVIEFQGGKSIIIFYPFLLKNEKSGVKIQKLIGTFLTGVDIDEQNIKFNFSSGLQVVINLDHYTCPEILEFRSGNEDFVVRVDDVSDFVNLLKNQSL